MSFERRPMDWERAHQRLVAGLLAIERALEPEPERLLAIYRGRAARLARAAEAEPVPAASVLVLRLGPERFGIEISRVAEVLVTAGCVAVPGSSAELAGVINTRGEIRPVWDLRRLLKLPDAAAGGGNCVVLVRHSGRIAGLLVDRVEEIRSLPGEVLRVPAPRPAVDSVVVLDPAELFREISG